MGTGQVRCRACRVVSCRALCVRGTHAAAATMRRSIWAIVWVEYSWVGVLMLVGNLCELALPVIYSWIIQFVGDEVRRRVLSHVCGVCGVRVLCHFTEPASLRPKSAGWSQGLLYVGLVFAVSVTHLVFQQMTYFRAQRVLMNVRTTAHTAHTARHKTRTTAHTKFGSRGE